VSTSYQSRLGFELFSHVLAGGQLTGEMHLDFFHGHKEVHIVTQLSLFSKDTWQISDKTVHVIKN